MQLSLILLRKWRNGLKHVMETWAISAKNLLFAKGKLLINLSSNLPERGPPKLCFPAVRMGFLFRSPVTTSEHDSFPRLSFILFNSSFLKCVYSLGLLSNLQKLDLGFHSFFSFQGMSFVISLHACFLPVPSGISHSVTSDMQTIEQETPAIAKPKKKYMDDVEDSYFSASSRYSVSFWFLDGPRTTCKFHNNMHSTFESWEEGSLNLCTHPACFQGTSESE